MRVVKVYMNQKTNNKIVRMNYKNRMKYHNNRCKMIKNMKHRFLITRAIQARNKLTRERNYCKLKQALSTIVMKCFSLINQLWF